MNKTCRVLKHCCVGGKWWDHNRPITKRVLAGKETHLKKSCHGTISNTHDTIKLEEVYIYKATLTY